VINAKAVVVVVVVTVAFGGKGGTGAVTVGLAFSFGQESGTAGVQNGRGVIVDFVVVFAVESVVSEREFVAGNQLTLTGRASETLDVVDLGLGPHHEVTAAETRSAFVAFGTEQSANNTPFITHWLTSTTRMLTQPDVQVPSTAQFDQCKLKVKYGPNFK
jgi:hypothetical protein